MKTENPITRPGLGPGNPLFRIPMPAPDTRVLVSGLSAWASVLLLWVLEDSGLLKPFPEQLLALLLIVSILYGWLALLVNTLKARFTVRLLLGFLLHLELILMAVRMASPGMMR